MLGSRGISKRERKHPTKPSDIWDETELAVFVKYCPKKRDKCYYAVAFDTSARPRNVSP